VIKQCVKLKNEVLKVIEIEVEDREMIDLTVEAEAEENDSIEMLQGGNPVISVGH
jgi:hypothetical protein